ncbi:MAG: hypothetical protein ACO1NQ_01330 [Flavobacteriales bacterium]
MANERLGSKNVELLLDQYRSERKRLIFQLNKVRDTIVQLKSIRTKEAKNAPVEGVKRGPGRPRKEENADAPKRGPGRPRKNAEGAPVAKRRGRKRARTGGYRLSPWDEMVIGTITKEGLLPKQILLERAKAWAKVHAKKMTAEDVEMKLTRVLQKLSGSRGLLGTHRTGLQRGYHYGLKEWFFASSGALRKQHLDKLVLLPQE